MSILEIEAVGIVLGMLCLAAGDRLHFNRVAVLALIAALRVGMVPPDSAVRSVSSSHRPLWSGGR